ncbi:hypothetical protein Tsubulata_003756 [Turnera subulata]|uniref:Uncharacterized protein n=1 Tax=Turnera subulata TaxID=218843 RepID=A0A9Q0G368_9ROSI|nr:hypothetical protein Tsubulata_003756 [Turnera subulata]
MDQNDGSLRAAFFTAAGREIRYSQPLVPYGKTYQMSVVVSGGVACAVGGDFGMGNPEIFKNCSDSFKYPLELWICDMVKENDYGNRGYPWVKGPPLNGGKPNALVVVIGGVLYALRGEGSIDDVDWKGPIFESLDLGSGSGSGWEVLPDPPFGIATNYRRSYMVDGACRLWIRAQVQTYSLSGEERHPSIREPGSIAYYYYDTTTREWSEFDPSSRNLSRARFRLLAHYYLRADNGYLLPGGFVLWTFVLHTTGKRTLQALDVDYIAFQLPRHIAGNCLIASFHASP